MNSMLKKTLCLLLALCLMAGMSAAAFAEEQSVDEKMSILDDAALKAMVNDLLASYNIEGQRLDHISFAYTYLATGDTWYYNPDMWYYPGSIYKVPMMMVLAEREAKGELSRDSDLGGYTLGEAEELILVWSNNDYAHLVRKYLGGDANARKLYQAYSDLPETYYHSDFIDYCFFTVRYMDDVMQHLYNNRENFPNIIESLLVAMPNNFYHLKIDPSIQIAQKYGAFEQFNANTGIIYTENPFVLTIMSDCLSYDKAEHLMGDAAKLFMDYTLALDAQLASYEQELAAAEAKAAEEARLKAEEEARIAREKAEAEAAAERERLAEEQRLKEEAEAAARREKIMKIAAVAGAAVAVIGAVAAVIVHSVRKKRRERELARRRELIRQRRYGLDEEESHASFRSSRGGRGSDSYRPRH